MANNGDRDILFDGELEVLPITESLHDQIIEFFKSDYVRNENVCKAIRIAESPEAIAEAEPFNRMFLSCNLGYIARRITTKDIVAFCINAVSLKTDPEPNFEVHTPCVIRAFQLLHDMKSSFDIFNEWNVDCVFEICFLSTRNDYGGRGLALLLCERSVALAHRMLNGILSEAEKNRLPEHMRDRKPKAIYSIFSSLYTQKIGKKLGFQTLTEVPYTELFFEGKSFAESINPIHKVVTLAGKKL